MTPRILIIDDKQADESPISKLLGTEGYSVLWASSLFRSLTILQWLRPNLIVMDGMTEHGWQLLGRLKVQYQTRTLPVIVCVEKEAQQHLEHQMDWHQRNVQVIPIPFCVDDFMDAVRQSLTPHRVVKTL